VWRGLSCSCKKEALAVLGRYPGDGVGGQREWVSKCRDLYSKRSGGKKPGRRGQRECRISQKRGRG